MSLFADVMERVNRIQDRKEQRKARISYIEEMCEGIMLKHTNEINSLNEKLSFKPEYDLGKSRVYVGMSRGEGGGRQLWHIKIDCWFDEEAASKYGEGFIIKSELSRKPPIDIPFSIWDTDTQIHIKFEQALRMLIKKALMWEY